MGAPDTTPRITEQARGGAGAERWAVSDRHRDTVVDVARICNGYSSGRGVALKNGVHVSAVHCLFFFQEVDETAESTSVRGQKIGRPVLGLAQ